jgi:hypothetical protein
MTEQKTLQARKIMVALMWRIQDCRLHRSSTRTTQQPGERMATQPVKTAIIGCGNISSIYLQTTQR